MSNQQSSLPGVAGLELYAGLTPSPPSVTEESVHIEGGLLFEHEVGGATELRGQDTQGLPLGVLLAEPVEIGLSGGIAEEEADGGLAEGPFDVGVADLGPGDAERLSVGFLSAFDESAVGREVLGRRETGDIADLKEKSKGEDLADAVDGHEKAKGVGVVDPGELKGGVLELGDEVVVVVEEGEVGPDAGPDSGIIKDLGEAFAVGGRSQGSGGLGQIVLGEGILDMGQELSPLASEVKAAAQEIASGAHLAGIDVGVGKGPGAKKNGNLSGIDLVILGLAAMDGLHVEGVAEDEGDALIGAEIGQPVPAEDALGPDDQVVTKRGDGLEEEMRVTAEPLMQADHSLFIENAEVEIAAMEVDAAGVPMLPLIEAHGSPPG